MPKAMAPDGSEHHTIIMTLVVRDVDRAIEFYGKAFGSREILKIPGPGGKTGHGQVRLGDTILFLAGEPPNRDTYLAPESLSGTSCGVYSYWDDCDAAFRKAVAAGASPLSEPVNLPWGDRVALVRDPFGHLWSLATRLR
jgi:uncharacterized glyoxalase superfamily protein PhnB